ncbi:hypothetical protein J6590_005117 [Homalodisca vitripennis]|nr:hypothetical protein J6590_005117 [Homalodisca vitripennis]
MSISLAGIGALCGILSQALQAKYHYNHTGVRVVGLLSGPTKTDIIQMAGEKQLEPEWGRLLVAYLSEPPPQRCRKPVQIEKGIMGKLKLE